MDIIKRVQTEWTSLIVFWPKDDATLCLCVELQKADGVTIRNSYPTFCIDNVLRCRETLGYFRLWMQIANSVRSRSPNSITRKWQSPHITEYFALKRSIWAKEYIRNVSARDGGPTYNGKMTVRFGLFRQYHNILTIARQTHRSCSTSSDGIEQRRYI